MKTVILAGGFGTRIGEESHIRPKPMIEIGERPILWHILKQYSHHGFNDFVVCLGCKGYVIKEYFAHHHLHEFDITFDFRNANERTVNARGVRWDDPALGIDWPLPDPIVSERDRAYPLLAGPRAR